MASPASPPNNNLLPLDVKRKVLCLIGIQKQYDSLQSQYQQEVLELDKKFIFQILQKDEGLEADDCDINSISDCQIRFSNGELKLYLDRRSQLYRKFELGKPSIRRIIQNTPLFIH